MKKQNHRRPWTEAENEKLRKIYPSRSNRDIGGEMGRTSKAINSRAKRLGLTKAPNYNRMKNSKMAIPEKTRIFIRDNYKKYTNHDLAELAGVSESTVQAVRREYGLSKKNAGCFEKGHEPFNKGLDQDEYMSREAIEKTKKTRFKKGNTPPNTKYDGAISIRYDHKQRGGSPYMYIRLARAKWVAYQIYRWQKANGPVPKGRILVCRDGNTLNTHPSNWEPITRAENARRNVNREKAAAALKRYFKENGHPARELHERYVAGLLSGGDKEFREYLIENRPDLIELARKNYLLRREILEIETQ